MPPSLTFHGAARAVTGSCFRLQTDAGQVLIDCGMFQGSKTETELNYRPFPFAPRDIAAVILSHAHIDHSGLLPKLDKGGYSGPIHATAATAELAAVMLPDSAHIQAFEVELNRRKAQRRRQPVEAIYSGEDVNSCLRMFRPEPYHLVCSDARPLERVSGSRPSPGLSLDRARDRSKGRLPAFAAPLLRRPRPQLQAAAARPGSAERS